MLNIVVYEAMLARGLDNLCRGKVTVDIAMLLRMPASEAIVICSFYLLYGGWYD